MAVYLLFYCLLDKNSKSHTVTKTTVFHNREDAIRIKTGEKESCKKRDRMVYEFIRDAESSNWSQTVDEHTL